MKFYTKPFLRYAYRYLFIGLMVGLPVYLLLFFMTTELVYEKDRMKFVILCGFLAVAGMVIIHMAFWEKFFAVLEITDENIIWKCLFRKSQVIAIDECKYSGVEEESTNGFQYPYIYFTTKPYPHELRGKINKVKCSNSFIKFWYDEKLAKYIIKNMPGRLSGPISAYRIHQKRRTQK